MFSKMTPNQMLMMAGGSTALVSIVHNYFRASNLPQPVEHAHTIAEICSKEHLLKVILELRMEYTPHYLHYYHMVCAVE